MPTNKSREIRWLASWCVLQSHYNKDIRLYISNRSSLSRLLLVVILVAGGGSQLLPMVWITVVALKQSPGENVS